MEKHIVYHPMSIKTIKSICLGCLALLIIFYSPKIDALSHEWIAVPKSQYGAQLWDKNSIEEHQDGFIRVLSKFIPKSTTEITKDNLYTMDINCSEESFRDIAVGARNLMNSKMRIQRGKIPMKIN